MSFADTMGRLNLPIVSFSNNGQIFNFIIDTGASLSVIDSNVLHKLNYSKLDIKGSAYGIDGNTINTDYVAITLRHEATLYIEQFQVMRLNAFDNLKGIDGIDVAGILGSAFLKRHGAILNYESLSACIKVMNNK